MSTTGASRSAAIESSDAVKCRICDRLSCVEVLQSSERLLVQCTRCGVAFIYPEPDLRELEAHFQKSEPLSDDENDQRFERNRGANLDRMYSFVRSMVPTGELLDVACATGRFLKRFQRSSGWQVRGIELSESYAARASASGLSVDCGTLDTVNYGPETFDVVTVLDAFYYFPTPRVVLRQIARILRPGGLLFLELPAAGPRIWRATSRIGRLLSGTSVPLLQSSDHIFYYAPRSLTLLIQDTGFEVEEIRLIPGNEQNNTPKRLLYSAFFKVSQLVEQLTFSSVLLGPRFAVCARRDTSVRDVALPPLA